MGKLGRSALILLYVISGFLLLCSLLVSLAILTIPIVGIYLVIIHFGWMPVFITLGIISLGWLLAHIKWES
jgi:hypothetical protein